MSWRWMWSQPSSRRCLRLWIPVRTIQTWIKLRELFWPRRVKSSTGCIQTLAKASKEFWRIRKLSDIRCKPFKMLSLCMIPWSMSPKMHLHWLGTICLAYVDFLAWTEVFVPVTLVIGSNIFFRLWPHYPRYLHYQAQQLGGCNWVVQG